MRSFIRQLSVEDAEVLADISRAAFGNPVDPPWSAEDFRQKLSCPFLFRGWLTSTAQEAIGFLLLQDHEESIEILKLATKPACQGRGIACELLATCFRDSPEKDIWLEVAENNKRARMLYEHQGFVFVRRLPHTFTVQGHTPVTSLMLRHPASKPPENEE